MSYTYEIAYAPVGASDDLHVWRVDRVELPTGNWSTIQGGLTKLDARHLAEDLESID